MIYPNLEALIDDTAADVAAVIRDAQRSGDGRARVVLTGGTAGIALLRRLRTEAIDWANVDVFFGDERNVPVDHPESNEGQAREALLDHVDIPEANIHGYGLDGGPMDAAVARYEAALAEFAPDGFDLHLLGMGGEGHINSLFPHTSAVREHDAMVVTVTDSPKPPAERATLTLCGCSFPAQRKPRLPPTQVTVLRQLRIGRSPAQLGVKKRSCASPRMQQDR